MQEHYNPTSKHNEQECDNTGPEHFPTEFQPFRFFEHEFGSGNRCGGGLWPCCKYVRNGRNRHGRRFDRDRIGNPHRMELKKIKPQSLPGNWIPALANTAAVMWFG